MMKLTEMTAASAKWWATVNVSCEARGVSWSGRKCYFMAAPQAEDFGVFLQVTFELVDADQWVEIYNREKEIGEADGVDYFGEFVLWGTTLKLRKPPESYQDMRSAFPVGWRQELHDWPTNSNRDTGFGRRYQPGWLAGHLHAMQGPRPAPCPLASGFQSLHLRPTLLNGLRQAFAMTSTPCPSPSLNHRTDGCN